MSDALWIAVVVGLGITQALQVSLLGAMGRVRGPSEAAFVSILGTFVGLTLALTIRGARGTRPVLPTPFDSPAVLGVLSLCTGVILLLALRGLPGGFIVTGLLAMPYLLAASFLAPRIGVGLFLAALITGQLSGGVLLDQFGFLGSATRPVDAVRIVGCLMLLAGVYLVRGFR
ncbi:MAG: DMT family transporter [Thermomicrobiales bacterium]|nr:DMT family transporter [Thermomicrobiales bacterium]